MRELSLDVRFSTSAAISLFEEAKVYKNLLTVLSHVAPSFLTGVELDLLLVSDIEMRVVNFERRGFDKSTDVLSFPLFQSFPQIPYQMIGEIVISEDTLKRQAVEIGHSELEEFYRLLVHGVLHLFGFDHETSIEDAILMRKKEDECLDLIFLHNHGT
jgi:probable rRNA maturation factor